MRAWRLVSLGELLRLERRPVKVVPEGQYAEIGIYCFGRGIFHKLPRSGFEVGNKDLFLIKEGDFIFQVTFAWEGAVALSSASEDGMFGSTRFPTFRVTESRCHPRYLLNYFKTKEGREQLVKISPGSAGRNRVLSLKRIPEVLVPLPPLLDQQRIVAKIEQLAAKIEEARSLRRQAVEEAEALLSARMHSIFNFDDRTQTTVGDYASVQGGYAFSSSGYCEQGYHQVVRIGNVRDGYIDLSRAPVRWNPDGDERVLRYELKHGDIVISMTGTRDKRDYGYVARVPANLMLLLNQRVGRFVVHQAVDKDYLFHFLRSPFFRDRLFPSATGTANQANIGNGDIERIKFAPPSLSVQQQIVAGLDKLQSVVNELTSFQADTSAELDALLPSVLDKAFKGEL